jgi:hypothetical protein
MDDTMMDDYPSWNDYHWHDDQGDVPMTDPAMNQHLDLDDQPTNDSPVPDNTRSMTLRQFCRRSKELLDRDPTDFVRFVLTGQDTDGRKLCIDPILNRITLEDSLDFIRDYDSVLGISSHVRVKGPLYVYPVPKNDETLSHTIHIRHKFQTADVSFCHRIPIILAHA